MTEPTAAPDEAPAAEPAAPDTETPPDEPAATKRTRKPRTTSTELATDPGETIHCPLPSCDWTYDTPPIPRNEGTGAALFGATGIVSAAQRKRAATVEAVVDKHLKSHPHRVWAAALVDALNAANAREVIQIPIS